MATLKYPNESMEYREARDALLEDEQALIAQVKKVAARRRRLPPGGRIREDYRFVGANDDTLGKSIRLSELFGDKSTLMVYSYMFGPDWDHPCPSCTSLIDGFDRVWPSVANDVAFVVIAKASAKQLKAWAAKRGWRDIRLLSAENSDYLRDYCCETGEEVPKLWPVMQVFTKHNGEISHFWGTEMMGNSLDMVWAYWNLMDMTPQGRPDLHAPPQDFRSRYIEKHYLGNE